MDNQDKIINKIKDAAHKAEQNDFPCMEKVWARIDEKLDNQNLQTKTKLWKKIAVAVSVLLVVSLTFQLAYTNKEITPEEQIIASKDSINEVLQKTTANPIVSTVIDTAKINVTLNSPNDSEIKNNNALVLNSPEEAKIEKEKKQPYNHKNSLSKVTPFNGGPIYDARITKSKTVAVKAPEAKPILNNDPLVLVNGKLVKTNKYKTEQDALNEVSKNNDDDELVTYTVLDNLLYIINGVEYSEASLFGANPTSPYAPLSKQKITSFTLLQGEEATEKYGEKGANGVAIITTKNKKPLEK